MKGLVKRAVRGIRRRTAVGGAASGPVTLFVGTQDGLFLFRSDAARGTWAREGPFLAGRDVNVITVDPHDPTTVYAGASTAGIFKSRNGGRTWAKLRFPPALTHLQKHYAQYSGKHPVAFTNDPPTLDKQLGKVWSIAVHPRNRDAVYAGIEPPALFRSVDGGQTWSELSSLRKVPFSHLWWGPFGAAFVTTIAFDALDPATIILGVSGGAGVVVSHNSGKTWQSALAGMTTFMESRDKKWKKVFIKSRAIPPRLARKGVFVDVHKLRVHPKNPHIIYTVNHEGSFMSVTGGTRWRAMKNGLPQACSRALALNPNNPKMAWTIPLPGNHKDGIPCIQGDVVAYRTRNSGRKWEPFAGGLPKGVELNIYRDGMEADGLDPCGVYFGTSRGELFFSADEGATWTALATDLPSVRAVTPFVPK